VSVIIPLAKEDEYNEKILGAGEVLKIADGSIASARNLGAARAKFNELLFLDADMLLPENLDLSTLDSFGFDIATAEYRVSEMLDYLLQSWQNFWAEAAVHLRCSAVSSTSGRISSTRLEDFEIALERILSLLGEPGTLDS
jgi:hypothetical protein